MTKRFEIDRGLLVEDGRQAICHVSGFKRDRSGVGRVLTMLNENAELRAQLAACRAKLAQDGVV